MLIYGCFGDYSMLYTYDYVDMIVADTRSCRVGLLNILSICSFGSHCSYRAYAHTYLYVHLVLIVFIGFMRINTSMSIWFQLFGHALEHIVHMFFWFLLWSLHLQFLHYVYHLRISHVTHTCCRYLQIVHRVLSLLAVRASHVVVTCSSCTIVRFYFTHTSS